MNRKRFGTDGVRGRFGHEPITPQTVLQLGWAAGCVLGGGLGGARGKVLVGKDTRVSGYLLESALEAGLAAAGVDVSLLGPMPTPAVAYLTRASRAQAGIVVSASHNAYQDNGIKFFGADGRKLPDQVESDIEARMDQPLECVESAALGKARRFPDAAGRYIESCKSTVPYGSSFAGLRIVIDCANGAAYHTAPSVFEELGASVHAIAVQPDGFNINAGCGSTDIAALQREVAARGADVGIALDGDGDRVVLVDAAGGRVDGDQLLYALAIARHRGGRLHGGVVGTLMSNLGLELALREAGIAFARARVGDRYVLKELLARGWELGGETSGHIICLDKCTTGDGIVAALEVLQLMVDSERSLDELVRAMSIYPQQLINVQLAGHATAGFDLAHSVLVAQAVRQAESELASRGRVVLRPSGTEPVVRVMVEGSDPGQVLRISDYLAETVATAAREGR